jgi:hypothetical protein
MLLVVEFEPDAAPQRVASYHEIEITLLARAERRCGTAPPLDIFVKGSTSQ